MEMLICDDIGVHFFKVYGKANEIYSSIGLKSVKFRKYGDVLFAQAALT